MTDRTWLMAGGYPVLLLRFDEKEEYSRQIVSGRLRFTKLATYRDLPSEDQGRLDRFEGLAGSLDGSKVRIQFGNKPNGEPLIIDDAVRVTVHYDMLDAKILSLVIPGRESFEQINAWTLKLNLSNDLLRLGKWVTIIYNVKELLRRLHVWASERDRQFQLRPIEYLDPNGHHPLSKNVGFRKFNQYAWQLEARLLVRGLSPEEKVTTIDLGDLSHCASVVHCDDLAKIVINFPEMIPNSSPAERM